MDVMEKLPSEKRLIDANALISYIDECSKESRFRVYYGYAKSFIDDAPTVDAVEVVRCRDCIKRYDTDECPMCFLNRGLYVECTEDDGFCDLGERKDGDRNG